MSLLVIQRRDVILTAVALTMGLPQSALAAGSDESVLSAYLAPRMLFLRVKKTNASTGEVYTRNCTGFLVGKEGWVVSAAHPFSAPVRDAKTKNIIKTEPVFEISGSIGEREPSNFEELRAHVVNDVIDIALLQFKNFSNPRQRLLLGRPSAVNTGEILNVSGFMYDDKPRVTKTMQLESKGGVSPLWNLGGEAAPGLSGAPVLNNAGALVAVFVGGDDRPGAGNFAVPINLFLRLMEPAEPAYADGGGPITVADAKSNVEQVIISHSYKARPVQDESIIRRPYVQTYFVPTTREILSASFSVEREEGLTEGPTVTVTERNVSVSYTLQSGPKSLGKIGWLEGAVTMDFAKKL